MEAIVNNLIKALGWSIFHSLWQGAIIYALLFAILMALPKMSSKVKHNLAFGALLLMLTGFCFTFYSIFELPLNRSAIGHQTILSAGYVGLNFTPTQGLLKAEAWFPFITSFYVAGIMVQLLLLFTGYQKLKQLKKSNTIVIPEAWQSAFESILIQLKITKTVKFFLSPKVNVPLVIGYFKPVVLFPVALVTQLELKQVEAILIHELSHIRRNDYALNLIKTFIETLLFFNPFIWLTSKFIHIEREHACDDLVIKHTGTPLTYAHALLKLELLKSTQAPILSLAATGNNQYLYQRIKRITNMKTTYMNAKQQLFILALALSTVFSLAWMSPNKQKETKKMNKRTAIGARPIEGKNNYSRLVLKADTDSTKAKRKYRIVISDGKGSEKSYNAIKEIPDSLRSIVIRNQFVGDSIFAFYNSKEWKNRMVELQKNSLELKKKFDSPEWKEHIAKLQKNSLDLKKKFDSPEWKEHIAKLQKNSVELKKKFESPEWKDQMAKLQKNSLDLKKKFESQEWKEHIAKLQKNSLELKKKFDSPEWKDNIARMQKNSLELKKKFDSPEWKAKIEEMKKLQESPEYKELKKKFDKDLEELKKSKGIKTDKGNLQFGLNNLNSISFKSAANLIDFDKALLLESIKPLSEIKVLDNLSNK